MLATPKPRRQARTLRWLSPPWDEHHPDWLRLDQQLPPDHRARLIDRLVDQLNLDAMLPDFCAGFGTASWPPALLLKLALYEHDRKTPSPGQWYRDCTEHLPVLWLLRGARPCRASLYDARRRLSPEFLEGLNGQVLVAARQEGLCPARRGSLDGTFAAAKGSRHRLLNRKSLQKRLDLLEQAVAADKAGQPAPPRRRWLARSVKGRARQLRRYRAALERLDEKLAGHRRRQARLAKAKRCPEERVVVSPGEPEAAVGPDKEGVVRPLYDVQLLRDLDSPFVLGYGVYATTTDAGLLPDMLARTRRLAGVLPEEMLADSTYASVQDLQECRDQGVTLYAPAKGVAAAAAPAATPAGSAGGAAAAAAAAAPAAAPEAAAAASEGSAGGTPGRLPLPVVAAAPAAAPSYYGKERFAWDAATRTYTCPAGQCLRQVARIHEERAHGSVVVEKYATEACAGCGQRAQCTRSKYGRQIKRLADEPLVEELRARMASDRGKELYRLRTQTIEREFADAKEHRGVRRFSGFGRRLAETQVGLLVLLTNGKAWLRLREAADKTAA